VFSESVEALSGRIKSIRSAGSKLIFIDLEGDGSRVQVMATAALYQGEFEALHTTLRRGDIIGIEGNPGRTKTGELTLRASKIISLSYCMHQLPKTDGKGPGMTMDTRYR